MIKQFITILKATGGCTINIMSGVINPKKGYIVAKNGTIPIMYNPKTLAQHIQKFIAANKTALTSGAYLGGWINDGLLYLDVCYNFLTNDKAAQFAAKNKQLSYWNCKQEAVVWGFTVGNEYFYSEMQANNTAYDKDTFYTKLETGEKITPFKVILDDAATFHNCIARKNR